MIKNEEGDLWNEEYLIGKWNKIWGRKKEKIGMVKERKRIEGEDKKRMRNKDRMIREVDLEMGKRMKKVWIKFMEDEIFCINRKEERRKMKVLIKIWLIKRKIGFDVNV